jgi:hypothetical protein
VQDIHGCSQGKKKEEKERKNQEMREKNVPSTRGDVGSKKEVKKALNQE